MPTAERGTTWHWLLPHDRWLGRFAGRAGTHRRAARPGAFNTTTALGGTRFS
jgi:hypothetical protein